MTARASRALAMLIAAAALAGGLMAPAAAQSDPPGRVAHLSLADGAVSFAEAGSTQWTNADANRPITRGDRLWVDRGARAELHAGAVALRLGALTHVEVLALDDRSLQLNLTQGRLSVRVREVEPGERLEIGTPNLAVAVTQPGEYRVDVDPASETTRVLVHAGAATAYGENSESAQLNAGQAMAFTERNLTSAMSAASGARAGRDGFDEWVAARERLEDESVTARYVPRELPGYQLLDNYGQWRADPVFGPVWVPRVTVADWAPYRYGHWRFIAPWGWTWIDDAPWGFAPMHYGRWTRIGPRWAWVPGPRAVRPVFAPALVAFVGGGMDPNPQGAGGSIAVGPGQGGVAWFPLGPYDPWRPGFAASARYVEEVNRVVVVGAGPASLYANQRRPGAVTAVLAEDFGRARPAHGLQRVMDAELAQARVVDPPPLPRRGPGVRERASTARALPPTAVLNQPPPPPRRMAAEPRSAGPRWGGRHDRRGDR